MPTNNAQQPTANRITLQEPSVKSLLIEMRFNGQPLATGTGFVANSPRGPVLITNRHNVTGRNQTTGLPLSATAGVPNEVVIMHHLSGRLGTWDRRIEPLFDETDRQLWIEHPTLGAGADFVALPLTQLQGVQLYPYTLGVGDPTILIGPAEVVSVVGFPFGITGGGCFAIWATGFMATEHAINYQNLPIFLIDCRSRQGQSGSAVIAHRAGGIAVTETGSISGTSRPMTRFLGIYSGRINAESDLGFVWKAAAILELVNSIPAI